MKINTVKRTPAQLRERESSLIRELRVYHGYMFSDTLPERDKSTMMMSRKGKQAKLEMAVVFKIMVPLQSSLGRLIVLHRANKRKNAKPRPSRAKRSSLSPAEKQQRNGTWKGHRE